MASDSAPRDGPRISPRRDEDLDEASQALVEQALGPGAPPAYNLMRTLAWNPGLLRRWLPYGARLLNGGKLPARIREICILRVAVRCRSDYEWSQHVSLGRAAGLSETEISNLADDSEPSTWPAPERAIICAVDELHEHSAITESTWAELSNVLDHAQLVEVPMLVGAYTGLAYMLNSFRVDLEPGLEGLPHPDGN